MYSIRMLECLDQTRQNVYRIFRIWLYDCTVTSVPKNAWHKVINMELIRLPQPYKMRS